jgi:hypothetical protein
MLLVLALYASTAHAGILAGFAGRQALPTRTRRTTTSSCCTTTGRPRTGQGTYGVKRAELSAE